jgi:hypothetical protein
MPHIDEITIRGYFTAPPAVVLKDNQIVRQRLHRFVRAVANAEEVSSMKKNLL